jgi:hypothetical protein
MVKTFTTAAIAAILLCATSAHAGPTAEQKCEGGKNQAAGKYAACVAKAEKGLVLKGDLIKYGEALVKCEGKLTKFWNKLELKATEAGTVCPSVGDQTEIQDFHDVCEQSVAAALAEGGTLDPCVAVSSRYSRCVVAGGQTVIDSVTGLEWVVTDDAGGLTDKDNTYTWCDGTFLDCTNPANPFDGTAKTVYIDGLNDVAGGGTNCFAGHCDWRLPSVDDDGDANELETIVLAPYPCGTDPCIDQPVFGPTQSNFYWSSSTYQSDPAFAWDVYFYNGNASANTKTANSFVRAVRTGS